VTPLPGIQGAIIAAGEGRRLREAGVTTPKPLVRVAGVPLLESAVDNLLRAGIACVTLIVSEAHAACGAFARERFASADLRVIVRTTASSLESFRAVLDASPPGRVLVSTVDAWCAPDELRSFAERAAARPDGATVLGLTRLVADEKPLWARVGAAGRIIALGGGSGDAVTAGLYLVSEGARRLAPPERLGRLRDYLGFLLEQGEPMFGELMGHVVDVDRPEDVALAEALSATPAGARA
jgi:NDP-sugar pyrophosphorylase family protein